MRNFFMLNLVSLLSLFSMVSARKIYYGQPTWAQAQGGYCFIIDEYVTVWQYKYDSAVFGTTCDSNLNETAGIEGTNIGNKFCLGYWNASESKYALGTADLCPSNREATVNVTYTAGASTSITITEPSTCKYVLNVVTGQSASPTPSPTKSVKKPSCNSCIYFYMINRNRRALAKCRAKCLVLIIG